MNTSGVVAGKTTCTTIFTLVVLENVWNSVVLYVRLLWLRKKRRFQLVQFQALAAETAGSLK